MADAELLLNLLESGEFGELMYYVAFVEAFRDALLCGPLTLLATEALYYMAHPNDVYKKRKHDACS